MYRKKENFNLYNMAETLFEFVKIKMIFDIAQTRAKIIWLHKTFFKMGQKDSKNLS